MDNYMVELEAKKAHVTMNGFIKICIMAIDEHGIFPYPAYLKKEEGNNCFMALMLSPDDVFVDAMIKANNDNNLEYIFSLDSHIDKNLGMALDSALIIFHLVRNQPTRLGILKYSWNGGNVLTRPVDWNNEHYLKIYKEFIDKFTLSMSKYSRQTDSIQKPLN